MRQLLYNAIKCPDGKILTSKYRHDYVTHQTECGGDYSVDGGLDYQGIGFSDSRYENLAVYVDDPHELIRERFEWGSYGKNQDEPLHYIKLREITEEHLTALLIWVDDKQHYPQYILDVFVNEKKWRKGNSE